MSFSPNTKRNAFTENNKSATRKPFHHVAKESLFFPFFFSFAFASLFPFSFVLFAKGVRCRAFTKRSRRKARAICSQTVSDQKFIHRTRDHPYFRGTNRVASNASFANVSSTTGAALLIRVVSSSSFSSRVKSAVDGVTIVSKCAERSKSRYEKKTNTFYFIRSTLKRRPVTTTTTTTMRSKVFASLAKRGEKRALLFARTWKRQNVRRSAMASKRRSKTVVKNAMNFPQNISNFFTPLLAFTKANELEKRSERAYLEYPVCVVVFIVYVRPLLCFDDVFCDVDIFPSITTLLYRTQKEKSSSRSEARKRTVW